MTSSADLTLKNTDIINNSASAGGGIFVSKNGTVDLTDDVTISGNSAGYGGGGAVYTAGTVNLYTDISGNYSPLGGGVMLPKNGVLNVYAGASVTGNTTSRTGSTASNVYLADGAKINVCEALGADD